MAVGAAAACASAGAFRSRPVPDLAAVTPLLVAAVASGLGAVGRLPHPVWPRPFARPPDWLPTSRAEGAQILRAAGAGGLGLVACGGVVVIVALLLGPEHVARSARLLGRDPAGVLGLLVACAALLPNAVLWAAAYAVGPGFAVGAGTVVAPTGARLGAVPDFPLLALAWQPGSSGRHLLVCVLPPLAALAPSLILGRAARHGSWRLVTTVTAALGSTVLAGAGMAAATWPAGGALAAGRMSALGPVPWQAGLAATAWLAVVTVPGAVLVRGRPAGAVTRPWSAAAARGAARVRLGAHGAVVRVAECRLLGLLRRAPAG